MSIRKIQSLFGLAIGLIVLSPNVLFAAVIEYSGSRNMEVRGVERSVSISLSIDDAMHWGRPTVQYMYDNYPPHAEIDYYYGYFDILSSELNIDGFDPMTGTNGRFYIRVTDWDPSVSGSVNDLSLLRLETEDVMPGWGGTHSRIRFLDDSGEPFDWSSWWGDSPTNDLPPLLGVNRLDVLTEELTGHYRMDEDPFLLHPVPLPAAVWLFGAGLIGLFGMTKRAKLG
ncbi:MAG: VPLPA-CTERM sorting domain-containing protein [Candidatus Thiodiazotropha sp.]